MAEQSTPAINPPQPFTRHGRLDEVSRLWNNRRHYRHLSTWLVSFYDRFLNSRLGRRFPLREKVCQVYLRGCDAPLYLRLRSSDWGVMEEVIFQDIYSPVFRKLAPDAKTIVDLGANIGLSLRLWRTHFPQASGIGVEPDQGNIEIARMNLRSVDGENAFTIQQACAVGKERKVFIDIPRGNEWATRMQDNRQDEASVPVDGFTVSYFLDKIAPGSSVDLLKCDIEGAEQELFADCAAWIGRVKHIIIELHKPYTIAAFAEDVQRNGGQFEVDVLTDDPYVSLLLLTKKE
jgi:FkbM family methyltransferase